MKRDYGHNSNKIRFITSFYIRNYHLQVSYIEAKLMIHCTGSAVNLNVIDICFPIADYIRNQNLMGKFSIIGMGAGL